jgi:hypothetical protein
MWLVSSTMIHLTGIEELIVELSIRKRTTTSAFS